MNIQESEEEVLRSLRKLVQERHGAERAWAYRNMVLLSNGFYSSDELIDMSLSVGFAVADPFMQIRRDTLIGKGVVIAGGSSIEGSNVIIGPDCAIAGSIRGNNISLGRENRVTGDINIDNVTVGDRNAIAGLRGVNPGGLIIGNQNAVTSVSVTNRGEHPIEVGNNNELCAGLSINIPFPRGRIVIGHFNSLGRDGGGVISSSYRFGRKWNGTTLIGSHVESTRGAEVLGFSILGWPTKILAQLAGHSEDDVVGLLVKGSLRELSDRLFDRLLTVRTAASSEVDKESVISLFGPVKIKRCVLAGKVTLKDDTRTQNAYIRDALLPERSKVYYSSIIGATNRIITVSAQDRAFEWATITEPQPWAEFPTTTKGEEYPASDAEFYGDASWDIKEGLIRS